MSECTLKENMHRFGIGVGLAVLLLMIGGGMVLIICAINAA
ncbi:MAG: hypothetical protein NT087_10155 [Deltaproteobacteria bacterium]|nr:hypothetical protein [Deltaproteobacteria bacterium]